MKSLDGIGRLIGVVILVAIALTISLLTSYWLLTFTSQHTKMETIQIYPSSDAEIREDTLIITLELRNYGTDPAYITKIVIANHPFYPSDKQNRVVVNVEDYIQIRITYPMGGLTAEVQTINPRTGEVIQDNGEWITTTGFHITPPITIVIEAITTTGNLIKSHITLL